MDEHQERQQAAEIQLERSDMEIEDLEPGGHDADTVTGGAELKLDGVKGESQDKTPRSSIGI